MKRNAGLRHYSPNLIGGGFSMTQRIRMFCLAIVIVACAAWPAMAARETHVYGIANFGGTGQCGSTSQTHPVHADTAAAFASWFTTLKSQGLWDDVRIRDNSDARGSYFTDKSKGASCSCTADDSHADFGADDADVIYATRMAAIPNRRRRFPACRWGAPASTVPCGRTRTCSGAATSISP
jgi:hypothetical protein